MYVIVGYIFLNTLHFVSLKERSQNIEYILTGSLVVGYIYYGIAGLIPFTLGEVVDCIGISLSSICIAYIIGLFSNSRYFIKLLDILKIRESGKKYLWDDLMDNTFPMKVNVYFKALKYTGYLFNYESYSNSPNLVIAAYMVYCNRDIIEDNSHDKSKIVILNTEKADKVEIIYNENSKLCNEIRLFCDIKQTKDT